MTPFSDYVLAFLRNDAAWTGTASDPTPEVPR